MVAKGLDFENVTLVGVVDGDLSLYADNYRAAERTFTADPGGGPGGGGGEARPGGDPDLDPENDVINLAARQDYDTFYKGERECAGCSAFHPF